MATVKTNGLRIRDARNMASSLSGSHIFVGKPTEWATGDESPPTPDNSVGEYLDVYNQMMSLKLIDDGGIHHSINKYVWQSGVTYDIYRHDYSKTNTANSGVSNLYDARFYVLNSNNNVYVCLFNNNNGQSSVEPQNTGDEPFYTSDGYQWLRVYNLTTDNLLNNGTDNYMPIIEATENDVVSTTDGSVYTVIINDGGTNYTTSPAGTINQIPYYFARIVGNGSGAVARVTITNGTITMIEVIRNGSGYTYGTLNFDSGSVYETLDDLDAGINGLNPLGDNGLDTTVIISPTGGWGSDLVSQLGATRVVVFSSLSYDNTHFDTNVTFRQIGIIKDSSIVSSSAFAGYGIKVEDGAGDYTVGETITQEITVNGETKVAKGLVVSWDSTNDVVKYIQDPKIHTDTDGVLYTFSGTGSVVGLSKTGTVDSDYTATINDLTFSGGYANPEVTKYTGELLYLSNISPVLRQGTQTEKVTLTISY